MIIRNGTRKQFCVIETGIMRSKMLRLDELGLYVTMLSHSDDWDFSIGGLCRVTDADPKEIADVLNRLQNKGFVRAKNSRFGTVWDLFEQPGLSTQPTGPAALPQAPAAPKNDEAPEPKRDPSVPEMTHEQIGLALKRKAEELKRINLARKIAAEKACRTARRGV